jgi:homoserine/homoserine lactone efflux protein
MTVSLETWAAYVATVLALMSTPGPSHLLMLSNSMSHGLRRSLATAAGDLSANALQMLAAGLGLASVLLTSREAFVAVKWAGVAYLVWMGAQKIRQARQAGMGAGRAAARVSLRRLYAQGFITSAANPKAVVFFAALFPLFLDPVAPIAGQLVVLGATYIVIDAMFLTTYGASASWVARRLSGTMRAMMERASGGFLIVAAVLLALRRIETARG